MKSKIKIAALIVLLTMMVGALTACDLSSILGGGGNGADVVIATKGSAISSFLLYGEPEDLAKEAATAFNEALGNNGYTKIFSIRQSSMISEDEEIIIGESDREASKTAAAKLNEKAANAPDDLHWAFCYKNGVLAIIANSKEAYEMAFKAFFETYSADDSITVKDNLDTVDTMTRSEYNAYLEELERIEDEKQAEADRIADEKRKEENKANTPALLEKLNEQRDELSTLKGTWNKYADVSSTNPELLLFTDYTKDLGASSWGTATTTPIDEHPRLLITKDSIPLIRDYLREDNATVERFLTVLRDKTLDNEGILPAPDYKGENATVNNSNIHNWDAYYLETIQAKALAYLVYEDEYYGYQAIYYMKNFLKSLDIVQIASDQCRQYGYVMFTAAIVYDWCYDLLTDVDKTQLIAGVENCICQGGNKLAEKMEVGFPPSKQGSVTGHGAEYQIMRDYLSFAVAIYGDNDSWWNYVAARCYNDYLPFRNYYFQSGMTPQGTGNYIAARHIADLYMGWILQTGVGENPFTGMENTVRSVLSYECAPGLIFTDGDGTRSVWSTVNYVSLAHITAFLYADAPMLAQADSIKGEVAYSASYSGLNSIAFLALHGLCDIEPAEDRYENMELIHFNTYPLSECIAREAWNDPNSAAVFMRIKERTTANHEHSDTGTFNVYYKGMLTADGGAYNHSGHETTRYFHRATIAHNGLIIFNPALRGEDAGYYSGGQRSHYASQGTFKGWLNDEEATTAVLTGMQGGYVDGDKSKPLYAYIAGDITPAYHAETVYYVGRRMLTVFTGDEEYPMALFVYDSIIAKNKTYEKRFLLQIASKDAPTVTKDDNNNDIVITENGDGRLVLTSLSSDVRITPVGGRAYTAEGKYDCANSLNYCINGKQMIPMNGSADDGHWGRIEIVTTKQALDTTFINTLYVTDKGNEKLASVRGTSSENGLTGSVFQKKIAALFVTSNERATSTVSCKTFGSGTMSYYVSGVAAGKWSVTVGGKSIGTFEATEEGGLLTFDAPAGVVEISPAN